MLVIMVLPVNTVEHSTGKSSTSTLRSHKRQIPTTTQVWRRTGEVKIVDIHRPHDPCLPCLPVGAMRTAPPGVLPPELGDMVALLTCWLEKNQFEGQGSPILYSILFYFIFFSVGMALFFTREERYYPDYSHAFLFFLFFCFIPRKVEILLLRSTFYFYLFFSFIFLFVKHYSLASDIWSWIFRPKALKSSESLFRVIKTKQRVRGVAATLIPSREGCSMAPFFFFFGGLLES